MAASPNSQLLLRRHNCRFWVTNTKTILVLEGLTDLGEINKLKLIQTKSKALVYSKHTAAQVLSLR